MPDIIIVLANKGSTQKAIEEEIKEDDGKMEEPWKKRKMELRREKVT